MSEPNSPAHKSLGAPSSQRSLSRCSRGWGLNFYPVNCTWLILNLQKDSHWRYLLYYYMSWPDLLMPGKCLEHKWGVREWCGWSGAWVLCWHQCPTCWGWTYGNFLKLLLYSLVCVVNDALSPVGFHLTLSSPIPGNQLGCFLQRDGVPGQDGSFLTKPIVCAGIWVSRCWSNLQEFYQTLLIWIKPSLFPGCETGAQVPRSAAAR